MPTLPLLMKAITMMVPLTMVMGEFRWGIMSTFPRPMLVMYNAQVFPRFFSTNKDLGVAYLPEDTHIEQMKENRTIPLRGSLCFTTARENETIEDLACITLKNQSAARMGELLFGYQEIKIKGLYSGSGVARTYTTEQMPPSFTAGGQKFLQLSITKLHQTSQKWLLFVIALQWLDLFFPGQDAKLERLDGQSLANSLFHLI